MNINNQTNTRRQPSEYKQKQVYINNNIRSKFIRISDDGNGKDLGIMSNQNAQTIARNIGLDLVQLNYIFQQSLSICKICDAGKYFYSIKQKEKEQKKKLKASIQDIKKVSFTIRIEDADFETKIRHIRDFIDDNNKVRIIIKLTRREVYTSLNVGKDLMIKIINRIKDVSELDQTTMMENNLISCQIKPIRK